MTPAGDRLPKRQGGKGQIALKSLAQMALSITGFHGMNQLGVLQFPFAWEVSPPQDYHWQ